MEELISELIDDLTDELKITDEHFDARILEVKVRNAVREVLQELGYSGLTDDALANKVRRYYSNVRNIALYDYNMIGVENQIQYSESGETRQFVSRNSLFNGILPMARF